MGYRNGRHARHPHEGAHYGEIAKSTGGFFFVWTLWALGALGGFTFIPLGARTVESEAKGLTMGSIAGVSPRFTARMAGLFYLLYIVMAGLAGVARRGILIGGDAAATSTNIIAHQSLYQWGFACDLLSVASYIIVVVLFHTPGDIRRARLPALTPQ